MTLSLPGTLGIDFGTSNSAVSWAEPGGVARLLPLEGAAWSMPTAVFYNSEDLSTHFGRDALTHYLEGTEGRLMRSLKSLLGSPLLLETTEVNHRKLSFEDIIATFLATLRERAAQALGHAPQRVVMGRPVHFVDDDPAGDALAQASLQKAAQAVGFTEVSFQLEPIAAALDYERRLSRESMVLVADIGGGTSDFTVVRLGPQRMQQANRLGDVLATHGVHIGGADFDHQLSLDWVMPLLGFGHLGPQGREVPSRVFFELSTWHLIHWSYQARAMAQAQALWTNYADRTLHQRLMRVLEQRLGHRLAHDVEQAKIRSSNISGEGPGVGLGLGVGSGLGGYTLDLSYVEAGLGVPVSASALDQGLQALLLRTVTCARECVHRAGLLPAAIDAIYLTGGSSALRPFQDALRASFVGVPLVEGDLFGGVASGLAYSR